MNLVPTGLEKKPEDFEYGKFYGITDEDVFLAIDKKKGKVEGIHFHPNIVMDNGFYYGLDNLYKEYTLEN